MSDTSSLSNGQARLAADGTSYRPNGYLQTQLTNLTATFAQSKELVSHFAGAPSVADVRFPTFSKKVDSNGDFDGLVSAIGEIDRGRQRMQEIVINRFDTLAAQIEQKLRAHAAALAAEQTPPSQQAAATPTPPTTPSAAESEPAETLFLSDLPNEQIFARSSTLQRTKQLLEVLESTAENSENRRALSESADELEQLRKLLPAPRESVPVDSQSAAPSAAQPTPPPKTFNAEKAADQLREGRREVREAMLSAWRLDQAFDQTSAIAADEREKCRIDSLAVKGIWLRALEQIGFAVLVTALVAFLVLVFADLIQTLLDTATNTGITAEASRASK